jgi:acetyl esterase/lipase
MLSSMNRLELAASILIVTLPLAAQTPATPAAHPAATITAPPSGFAQTIVLWPDGAPLAQGTTEGDIPKLFTYPTTGADPHSAVIVMPGGGYTHEVMEQEGAYEARWLAAHGVAAFVLEYRLSPAYEYPAPMLDASRAIRYVRSHAAELGVKPDAIGVWGFSAAGISPHIWQPITRPASRRRQILSIASLTGRTSRFSRTRRCRWSCTRA